MKNKEKPKRMAFFTNKLSFKISLKLNLKINYIKPGKHKHYCPFNSR